MGLFLSFVALDGNVAGKHAELNRWGEQEEATIYCNSNVVGGKTSGKANFPTKYFPINAKMEFNLLEWRMFSKKYIPK